MPAIDRSVVADVPMFAGLPSGDVDDILREARAVRYAKGAAVFEQGAEADAFFVLLHGHLRVEKTSPQGHQIVVRYVSAGEVFGVAQALELKHYPATAIAAVESVVLCWPAAAWPRLTAKFPALATSTLQTVGRRLQDTQARVMEMSGEQASRAQNRWWCRNRFPDQSAGHRRDDRDDAAHGQPHPQCLGQSGYRGRRTPADCAARRSRSVRTGRGPFAARCGHLRV
jgi:CRP-like cAMP-binding protein